jgi:metallo-beta-lactamase class B
MNKAILIFAIVLICKSVSCQNNNKPVLISSDLELLKISDNAYIHISYASVPKYGRVAANGLIFINGKEAFLFDTPWTDSLTRILITYLDETMGVRIVGFVPNHWHEDCMGGIAFLKSRGINTYANQKTIDIAKSKNLSFPDNGFSDSLSLSLGDKAIKCYFPGAAHSKDNIVVWIPSEKILFPGCMVKSMNANDLGNIADGDLKAYPATINWVIEKFTTAKIVIPGHGDAGGPELLIHTMSLALKQ